jgi:hypothetical protein
MTSLLRRKVCANLFYAGLVIGRSSVAGKAGKFADARLQASENKR